MYTIHFGPAACRLFKKLPQDVQEKLVEEMRILETQPAAGMPLKGKYHLFRSLHLNYKGSAYRIIYQVFAEAEMIVIRLAATRENLYRKLDEMKVQG